jgi:signal transduction histidine kinase
MKKLAQGLRAQRKTVLIFVSAILLPALVVGYMSLNAFSKRREAVQRLLESNLWISGETSLRAVEEALLERERRALRPENFSGLAEPIDAVRPETSQSSASASTAADLLGRPFLLDDEFHVIFPQTETEQPTFSRVEEVPAETEFTKAFRRAETLEFARKDFDRAARAYRNSAVLALSRREKAIALDASARCLMSSGNLNEARTVYAELAEKYGRIRDKAGHLFGLTAALQVYEIAKLRNLDGASLKALLDLYQGLKAGEWPVSLPEYDFFASEIESAVEERVQNGRHAEIEGSYRAAKASPSPYLQSLLFAEFLRRDVVPKIRERIGVSSMRGGVRPGPDRLLANQDKGYCLVSYARLQDVNGGKAGYAGFCWDLETLKKEILPEILGGTSKETGLKLENLDENGLESPDDKAAVSGAADSLSLPYRQFPLPWKLLVTQPALGELQRTARRENLLYGTLLAFIFVLMLFGAFLLGRDISREAETTRLKTEFVHNISHELKTPLTLIRLYGETLQRKADLTEKERKESYEIITKESERLSHLINNVLDFSRIDMGRKEFTFTTGFLPQVIRETLDSYRYHLEKKGFRIQEQIDEALPEMRFDREAVASTLVNLLSNAMKFSPDRKEVAVRLFRRGDSAVIQVEDKGIGISAADLPGIFKRFYRAKNAVVSETRGSGLGLTLVKHMAEAHGGTAEVESELGNGSVFSIVLPFSGPERSSG